MGSNRFRSVERGGLVVTEAWFPPHAVLAPHVHDRACVAVILGGAFEVSFQTVRHDCPLASVHTEPLGDRHANRVGSSGAHVVVLQPDPRSEQLVAPLAGLLGRITQQTHLGVAGLASRLIRELDAGDRAAPLVQEALALEMLALAARAEGTRTDGRVPAWLLQAQEYVHAHCLDSFRAADLATHVGVDPAQLTRAFRRYFRVSLGTYVRRLRLEWAADQLDHTEEPLAAIALRAGFADQSHFTRSFARYAGLPPGRYRAARAAGVR
jgi:AraC family transcriptional regulator